MDTHEMALKRASLTIKAGAFIIDIAAILTLLIVPYLLTRASFLVVFLIIVFFLVLCLRDSVKGQSLGKFIFGIAVRDSADTLKIPSIKRLFIRNLTFFAKNADSDVYHIAERQRSLMVISVLCAIAIPLIVILAPTLIPTRTPLSPEEFVSHMESMGFNVDDRMYHWIELGVVDLPSGSIQASYRVINEQFVMDFVVFSTVARARSGYAETKHLAEQLRGSGSSTHSEINLFNFSRYTQTAGGLYVVVSRIGSTLLFTQTLVEDRDSMVNILRQLGY